LAEVAERNVRFDVCFAGNIRPPGNAGKGPSLTQSGPQGCELEYSSFFAIHHFLPNRQDPGRPRALGSGIPPPLMQQRIGDTAEPKPIERSIMVAAIGA
jgi:hypothetical protein